MPCAVFGSALMGRERPPPGVVHQQDDLRLLLEQPSQRRSMRVEVADARCRCRSAHTPLSMRCIARAQMHLSSWPDGPRITTSHLTTAVLCRLSSTCKMSISCRGCNVQVLRSERSGVCSQCRASDHSDVRLRVPEEQSQAKQSRKRPRAHPSSPRHRSVLQVTFCTRTRSIRRLSPCLPPYPTPLLLAIVRVPLLPPAEIRRPQRHRLVPPRSEWREVSVRADSCHRRARLPAAQPPLDPGGCQLRPQRSQQAGAQARARGGGHPPRGAAVQGGAAARRGEEPYAHLQARR